MSRQLKYCVICSRKIPINRIKRFPGTKTCRYKCALEKKQWKRNREIDKQKKGRKGARPLWRIAKDLGLK